MMHDIMEKKTDFIRSNYDATKEKMTEYEIFSKRQLRQGQKIVQQRNRLHSRIGEKDRALKLADIKIKDEKYTSQRLVQRLEKGNKELELSVEKEKNKTVLLERKLKKTEESRDLWKKKTEELTENIRELKQNTLSKPSASDQLFLDQKRMEHCCPMIRILGRPPPISFCAVIKAAATSTFFSYPYDLPCRYTP